MLGETNEKQMREEDTKHEGNRQLWEGNSWRNERERDSGPKRRSNLKESAENNTKGVRTVKLEKKKHMVSLSHFTDRLGRMWEKKLGRTESGKRGKAKRMGRENEKRENLNRMWSEFPSSH